MNFVFFIMSSKYQIIQVDNWTVRKMNLISGENIVRRINTDETVNRSKVEQAVKINVSANDEMTITPYEGISCYIKNYKEQQWKRLEANWTVPLKAQDKCFLFPVRIWIKVIPKMDQTDEISSPKIKPKEILEGEPPNKKLCTDFKMEVESKHALNNNDNDSYLIENVNIDNVKENIKSEDIRDQLTIEFSTVQDSNFDNKKNEQQSVHEKESNEELAIACSNEQESELNCEKHSNKGSNPEDNKTENFNNSEFKAVEQNTDISPVNSNANTDNVDQAAKQNTDASLINSNADSENVDQAAANTQLPPRVMCKYGSQCYRLSAEHKTTFSHPGDADYDVLDNRPECPYGLDCYRKNPQHKLDYKHTRSKRKQTQTAARRTSPEDLSDLEDSWEESIDESDYDPSFIDDDSIEEFESDFDDDDDDEKD